MLSRILSWTAAAALVLLAGYGIWRFLTYDSGFFIAAAESLPDELAKAKAEGVPLEPDDLRADPPVPNELNAADIYRDAIALKKTYSFSGGIEKPFVDWVEKPSPATLAAAKARMAKLGTFYKLVDRAAQRPHCDYDRRYEEGFALLLPEYAQMKTIVKVLAYSARIHAKDGRIDEAINCLKNAARVAEHAGQDPILIAMLVRLACEGIVNRSVEVIASDRTTESSSLIKLEAFVRSLPPPPKYEFYLGAEVVGGRLAFKELPLETIAKLLSGGGTGDGTSSEALQRNKTVGVSTRTKREAYEAQWVRFCREAHDIARTHEKDGFRIGKELDKLVVSKSSDTDPTYIAVEVMAPVYAQAGASLTKLGIARELLLLKIDLLQYRMAHDRFPPTLKAIGRETVDPFTKKPIVYRPGVDEFQAYSFGPNEKGDGGGTGTDDVSVEHPMNPKKK